MSDFRTVNKILKLNNYSHQVHQMCTLLCGLIICTLVSTARTTATTIAYSDIPIFDSSEVDESTADWYSTHSPKTTTIAKHGSKTTLDTPSVTDKNFKYGNKSVENDVIENSTKTGNDYHTSDKHYSSTEPMPTINVTQSLEQPPIRTPNTTAADANVPELGSTDDETFEDWTSTKLPSTTLIAIMKNRSTTTPGTLSVTDLNVKPSGDVIGNSTSQPKPKNGYEPSHKTYSSTEPISAKKDTQLKPKKQVIKVVTMRSKDKYPLLGPISSVLANKKPPTRYYKPTKWIKPTNKNCKCVFDKNYSKHCKNNEKETPTTKIWGRLAEYNQWQKQRHMIETTTSNYINGKSEESKKWKRRESEMESNRFHSILDVFNSPK